MNAKPIGNPTNIQSGKHLLLVTVLIALLLWVAAATAKQRMVRKFVETWKPVTEDSAAAGPEFNLAQLQAGSQKAFAANANLTSWEMRCQTRFCGENGARETNAILMVRNGRSWHYERGNLGSSSGPEQIRIIANGELVQRVYPVGRKAIIQSEASLASEETGASTVLTQPVGVLPVLGVRGESYFPSTGEFPDLLGFINDPTTKLLPGSFRVGERACRVLERTVTTETPIFRTLAESDAWRKEHSGEERVMLVDPTAQPGDKNIERKAVRLALDPDRFLPVRWAEGVERLTHRIEWSQFPVREITFGDFQRLENGALIPRQLAYAEYSFDDAGEKHARRQSEVLVESFRAVGRCPPGTFAFHFPENYSVLDSARGIAYSTGDSKEKIASLIAAADRKRSFYNGLREKPAPALAAATWLNNNPGSLKNLRGQPVTLHFWSITCKPCVSELPRLQAEYERNLRQGWFISIHPFVDGAELSRLRELVRKHRITFPVMIDTPVPDKSAWGRTFLQYRIFGVPQEVEIDAAGCFAGLKSEAYISEGDWWVTHDQSGPGRNTQ